jgi:CheY-like chemotaxis protein
MAKGRILVVDDEIYIVHILDFSLGMEGYEVVTALDGEQALERARSEKPDLIVLDIMMPKLDGYETCKRLKADPETKDVPVILLSQRGPEGRLRGGRGRLHHQAVQPPQAGRAHQRHSRPRHLAAAHAGLARFRLSSCTTGRAT